MMQLIITLYVLGVIIATLKLAFDVWEATHMTVPFVNCLEKVVFEKESYFIILMPWRAFC